MRRILVPAGVALAIAIAGAPAQASPFVLGPTSTASGLSPWLIAASVPYLGGSGSAWPWRGRSCMIRLFYCWMSPGPGSTERARNTCSALFWRSAPAARW